MFDLLKTFSWQELIQHPWRNAAAVVAVMLGVALAFSVQLINASALDEFSQAVRSVNGQPDLELRSVRGSFDEAVFARVARHPLVRLASPVLELGSYAQAPDGRRAAVRVVGIDALVVPFVAPDLMPRPLADADRLALFAPDTVFLNAAAQKNVQGSVLRLQSGLQMHAVTVAGSVRAGGAALAVMDIGAAQELFGKQGQLTRIDLRLQAGVDAGDFMRELQSAPDWPPGLSLSPPGEAQTQAQDLSRAYRVNLSVLALGVIGSAAGIALGTALAALALRLLGGDLGGGFFSGVSPQLQWGGWAALGYGVLGLVAALVGGWWPARQAQCLPPAQTLKGQGSAQGTRRSHWISIVLIAT